MFDEDEEEYEQSEDETRAGRIWRIIKKTVKGIALTVVFGTIALLLARMFMSGDPSSMKALSVNDRLAEAYRRDGDLRAVAQVEQVITHEKDEDKGYNYGYFSVTDSVFFPTAEQVQIVFRYNDSTLRHLMEDYGLTETPDKNLDWYDVTMRVILDRTPENKKDNGETYWSDPDAVRVIRIQPTDVSSATKPLYSYRRFTFDGVPSIEDDNVLAVYIDVYYKNDIDYNKKPYGDMRIYTGGVDIHEYRLSGKDIKALEKISGNAG